MPESESWLCDLGFPVHPLGPPLPTGPKVQPRRGWVNRKEWVNWSHGLLKTLFPTRGLGTIFAPRAFSPLQLCPHEHPPFVPSRLSESAVTFSAGFLHSSSISHQFRRAPTFIYFFFKIGKPKRCQGELCDSGIKSLVRVGDQWVRSDFLSDILGSKFNSHLFSCWPLSQCKKP